MSQVSTNFEKDQNWRGKYILLIPKIKLEGGKTVHPRVMCEADIKRLLNVTSH